MSWNKIVIKLVVPYAIFVGLFVFSRYQIEHMCDCFANSYEKIVVNIMAIVFFIGSMLIAYSMKKSQKEWKIIYTILTIILFFSSVYAIMEIGEYFYVPVSRF